MQEQAIRKSEGYYWKVNIPWIQKQILKNYAVTDADYRRQCIITFDDSNTGNEIGYIFFSIKGSPPKGCAIYQPDHNFLTIIDAFGKPKGFKDIKLLDDISILKKKGSAVLNQDFLKNVVG